MSRIVFEFTPYCSATSREREVVLSSSLQSSHECARSVCLPHTLVFGARSLQSRELPPMVRLLYISTACWAVKIIFHVFFGPSCSGPGGTSDVPRFGTRGCLSLAPIGRPRRPLGQSCMHLSSLREKWVFVEDWRRPPLPLEDVSSYMLDFSFDSDKKPKSWPLASALFTVTYIIIKWTEALQTLANECAV
jgi:hypothetical protein